MLAIVIISSVVSKYDTEDAIAGKVFQNSNI